MESQTAIGEREIPLQTEKTDVFIASYMKSLELVWTRSQEIAQYQVQLQQVKHQLREAEGELVKTLAVKTRKEAKRIALKDAIASPKARVEHLKTSINEYKTKNQHYATFLSQQSLTSEWKLNESIEHIDETQEAISWYNRVLGLHVEGGRGTKELIHELNKTNGLFTFVRVMRKKFQEVVAQGRLVLTTVEPEETVFIPTSAPVLSMSSFRSDSVTKENEHQVETTEGDTHIKKQNARKREKSAVLSPRSASSVRRSPRLKLIGVLDV